MSAQLSSSFSLSANEKKAAVAVIGLGALFPGRPGLAGFWSVVKNGLDAMTPIPPDRFAVKDYYDPDPKAKDKIYAQRGAFLSRVPFEPLKYGVSPRDMESIDATQLLGLLVADWALSDSGYPADKADHSRTAVILGVTGALKMVVSLGSRLARPQLERALGETGVDGKTAREVIERFLASFTPWTETSFPGLLGNVTAGRIASRLNLGGSNMVVDAACASSLAAVHQSILELRTGRADLVVTGGMDTFSDPFMYACFSKTPALSRAGEVRSFDAKGDGTMLGEGLGALILKRLEDAENDHNRIYAIIRGSGAASDGRGTAIFAPSPQGQKRALEAAFREAGFSPATVELLEAHGTGTAVGDAAELSALSSFFGEGENPGRPWCALGSVKSQIGHAKAAAGAAGLIKAVLALHYKVLPPTINVQEPLAPLKEESCPFYLNDEARPWLASPASPRRAGVSAFGFGGSNFHCLLEEAGEIKIPFETGVHLLPFSGDSLAGILEDIRDLTEEAHLAVPSEALEDEKFTADYFSQALDYHLRPRLSNFRADAAAQLFLAFPAEKGREFLASLPETLSAFASGSETFSLPDGVFLGKAAAPQDLLYYVPGAFNLAPRTGLDLSLNFSHFQMILDLFAQSAEGSPLGLLLYPPAHAPASLSRAWAQELQALPSRYFLEPALAIALSELYSFFGLSFAQTSGRGPGLLAALVIAGWLPLKEAIKTLGSLTAPQGAPPLAEALASLPLAAPQVASQPALLDPQGEPFQGPAEILELLLKDLETLQKGPEGDAPLFPQETEGLFPRAQVLYAGGGRAHDLSLNSDGRILPAPQNPLELAQNLALLASQGRPVAFKNWAYFTFPPSKPTGHFVYLSGANLFTPPPSLPPRAPAPEEGVSPSLAKKLEELRETQTRTLAELGALAETVRRLAEFPAKAPAAPPARPVGENPPPSSAPRAPAPSLGLSATPWEITRDLIARETGYPTASLRPDLELENDLGLDSIKRVEILSELSSLLPGPATFDANVRTLADVAAELEKALARASSPPAALAAPRLAPPPPPAPAPFRAASPPDGDLPATILAVIARETGYPASSLSPDLSLEGDLGLDSIKKVEILSAICETVPSLEPASLSRAETIGDLLSHKPAPTVATSPAPRAPAAFRPAPRGQTLQGRSLQGPAPALPPASSGAAGPFVIRVISRETGFPEGVLAPAMNLENDLGLDSIKKVEILSLLAEEAGGLPPDGHAALTQAQTLGEWLSFFEPQGGLPAAREESAARSRAEAFPSSPAAFAAAPPPNAPLVWTAAGGEGASFGGAARRARGAPTQGQALLRNAVAASARAEDPFDARALAAVPWPEDQSALEVSPQAFEITPVPLELAPFDPTGLGPIVIVGSDALSRDLEETLRSRGLEVRRSAWGRDWADAEGLSGVSLILVWPGPDRDPGLAVQALQILQRLEGNLRSVTGLVFLGGTFAFPQEGREAGSLGNSASAALSGLVKCAAREWPDVLARIVDLPLAAYETPLPSLKESLLRALFGPGPLEIGLPAAERARALSLKPYRPSPAPQGAFPLAEGDAVLVTGGGRGVTAAILKELARRARPRLIILGRTPLGPPEPSWLASLNSESEIYAAFHEAFHATLSPKELAARAKLALAARELRLNLKAFRDLGAEAEYLSGDFGDLAVAEETCRRVRARYGPIRGFIHGAGVLRDHPLKGKKSEDFALVHQTKAALAAAILGALEGDPLRLILFMSSLTARLGRAGQADYAAGNETLNKMAWEEARARPEAVVASVGWGPWAGGMVTDSLARQFAAEKIGLIPLRAGALALMDYIAAGPVLPSELLAVGGDSDHAALIEAQELSRGGL
ncbi:MAG: KR domain-containing protein [Deltaproteobacteria bacterium]|jgi:3-oxoacyl-(acyl-carrier-protein) synthase/acyl carrier protein/NAD(P)-dependent dehydrogenase (short-subunit alcohol dehydrogenase family)|nr:KR domain-containing protein [Deltaproteobacteria bacterium]